MKTKIKRICWTAITLTALALLFGLAGCTLIWSDDVFIVDAFKDRKADSIYMHRDPNGYMIQARKYRSKGDPNTVEAAGTAAGKLVNTAVKGF
jgi:hypothetical protein